MPFVMTLCFSVISLGGDGTFTEVFNGLIQRQMKEEGKDPNNIDVMLNPLQTTIGILPAG